MKRSRRSSSRLVSAANSSIPSRLFSIRISSTLRLGNYEKSSTSDTLMKAIWMDSSRSQRMLGASQNIFSRFTSKPSAPINAGESFRPRSSPIKLSTYPGSRSLIQLMQSDRSLILSGQSPRVYRSLGLNSWCS